MNEWVRLTTWRPVAFRVKTAEAGVMRRKW